ncbi:patatin-like protein 1 [Cannabis sativa]|uniref:patatin-like protein 1 n=1 Tax=Cannabis sativa TaxID=3483 RepID=UPI0029CA3EF6|nr:patatin-like protein 1 [Cannabis sativa]XP_060975022.1 patatin-like protein 1 [Cannabis sativa]
MSDINYYNIGVEGDTTTILSIDGGGVRGIIPGVFLDYLESKLKELDDNKNARIADYFDVMSGTSTGGLITTMISTPNDKGRPLFAAKDIVPFYKQECPKIFSNSSTTTFYNSSSYPNNNNGVAVEMHLKHSENSHEMNLKISKKASDDDNNNKSSLGSPTYDGNYLHELLRKVLMEKRLSNTLTKMVILTYDIYKLLPVVFSSFEVNNGNEELDAKLADICISTSAAPTYLPAYKFSNKNVEFNMIDGAIAANNPTMAAITEVVKSRAKKIDIERRKGKRKREEHNRDLVDSPHLLVLSLGTGAAKNVGKYDVDTVNNWSVVNWINDPIWNLFGNPDRPILEILLDANADMVDHYTTMFFNSSHNQENFLRIQDSTLPKELAAMDNASPENMDKLEQYAKDMLKKPVTRLSLPTSQRIIVDQNQTYQLALDKFAEKLIAIKKSRAKLADSQD